MKRTLDADLVAFMKTISSIMPPRPGLKYTTFEGYYLAEGHPYPHAPYTETEADRIEAGIVKAGIQPRIKECFYNAQSLALWGGFGYAEGYALASDLPVAIHHAWAVFDGKPVDVTLRREKDPPGLLQRASLNLSRVAYYGTEFPKSVIAAIWRKEKIARAVIEDWKGKFPLLRAGATS